MTALMFVPRNELSDLSALRAICVVGADVYGYAEAMKYRDMERRGLVRCVPAISAPENGAEKQPYFGVFITSEGRSKLVKAMIGIEDKSCR